MNIAVYCGSDYGKGPDYKEAAKALGCWIAENGHSLVYGAGDAGLMGIVAKEVHEKGGKVYGVIPGNVDFIRNRPQPYCTEVFVEENMSARKQRMLNLADVFVALPGGTGTLDEIAEALTLTKIGVFDKPCILFNKSGFYEPLKALFDKMKETGFIEEGGIDHVLFSDDTAEIAEFIARYPRS